MIVKLQPPRWAIDQARDLLGKEATPELVWQTAWRLVKKENER